MLEGNYLIIDRGRSCASSQITIGVLNFRHSSKLQTVHVLATESSGHLISRHSVQKLLGDCCFII